MSTNKLIQKYTDILNTGTIQKNELTSFLSLLNSDKITTEEKSNLMALVWDASEPIKLSPEQNKQGIEYLNKLYKTPTGKERLNCPFGYREKMIIDDFSHFELRGFYNTSMYGGFVHYVPLYNCIGDNNSFEYYMSSKGVQIVG